MHRGCSWLLLFLLAVPARASIYEVLYAQQVMAIIAPAHVVRLGVLTGSDQAPRSVHTLVFGFDHVLWAYLPELGTVALGPFNGDAALTPEIITSRLRAADPAIRDVEVFRDARARSTPPRLLHNGCFLGCIVGLIGLLENGDNIQEAGFVFLTVDSGADSTPVSRFFAPQGHALLVYRTGGHWFALDPRHADQPIDLAYIRPGEAADTRLLDYAVRQNYPATAAHYLPVSPATLAHLGDDVVWLRRDARLQQGLVAL